MANNLSIANVDAGYGSVRVLENVSLVINGGETVVLLGTNGNGKSTLMSAAPSQGIIALSDGGLRPATSHCVIAKYETPLVPTRPLLHGCLPAHSMAS